MSSRLCIQMCEPCTYDTDRKVPHRAVLPLRGL